jgi:hypothetical protein
MENKNFLISSVKKIDLMDKFLKNKTPLLLERIVDEKKIAYTLGHIVQVNPFHEQVVLRPTNFKYPFFFQPFEEITVRNQTGNISFSTNTGKISRSHFLLLKLPFKINFEDRRKFFREDFGSDRFMVEFNNVRTLDYSKDSIFNIGQIMDISEMGMSIRAEYGKVKNFTVGDRLIFTLIHNYPINEKISGTIRTINEIKAPKRKPYFRFGIEFDQTIDIDPIIEHFETLSGSLDTRIKDQIIDRTYGNRNLS